MYKMLERTCVRIRVSLRGSSVRVQAKCENNRKIDDQFDINRKFNITKYITKKNRFHIKYMNLELGKCFENIYMQTGEFGRNV